MKREILAAHRSRFGHFAKPKRGQAMVEMAIVAMFLLMLTFGTADIGIYMYKYVQAANCTREAARRAAVRKDYNNIPYCVDNSLKIQVTFSDPGHAAGTDVTAKIDTDYDLIVLDYLIWGNNKKLPLKSSTTMRMEGQKI